MPSYLLLAFFSLNQHMVIKITKIMIPKIVTIKIINSFVVMEQQVCSYVWPFLQNFVSSYFSSFSIFMIVLLSRSFEQNEQLQTISP